MSWFSKDAGVTEEVKVVVEENVPFYVESGEYVGKVEFAGVYQTPNSPSKGLYIRFLLESGMRIDQYINYQNKEGIATRTLADGRVTKSIGLAQIESWDEIIGFGKPTREVQAVMWGKEREAKLLEDAVGKKVGILVRHVLEPSEDGSKVYNKNEVEMVFDLQTRKTSGQLYFEEDDKRHTSINDWLKKIEKNPTLDRTNKKKKEPTEGSASDAVKSAGW
jgi:hypothetical protein